MKYKLHLILVSIFVFSCEKNADYVMINDWQYLQLKGKVSSCTEVKNKVFESLGTIVNAEQKETTFIAFNDRGYLVEESKKVNEIKELRNIYDYRLNYDYIYDQKGNVTEKYEKDNYGRILNKFKFTFDKSTNSQKINIYNSNGLLEYVKTVRLNNQWKPLEITSVNSQGKLFVNILNTYDERGNNIKSKIKNNLSESIDSFRTINVHRRFDNFGNIIEEKENIEGEEHSYSYKYEFDSQGNWTKKIEFINEIPKSLIKRKISYFK